MRVIQMNNSPIIILENSSDIYKQVMKHLELSDIEANTKQTKENTKQDKENTGYATTTLSMDMGAEIAIMLDEIVRREGTKRAPLVRKILKQYCDYYFGNGDNIEMNAPIVRDNPREQ